MTAPVQDAVPEIANLSLRLHWTQLLYDTKYFIKILHTSVGNWYKPRRRTYVRLCELPSMYS